MDGEYWRRDDNVARLRMEASINQGNAKLCGDAADEIERLRLTDAEREAVEVCAQAAENCNGFGGDPTRPAIHEGRKVAATLRGLLERTK